MSQKVQRERERCLSCAFKIKQALARWLMGKREESQGETSMCKGTGHSRARWEDAKYFRIDGP